MRFVRRIALVSLLFCSAAPLSAQGPTAGIPPDTTVAISGRETAVAVLIVAGLTALDRQAYQFFDRHRSPELDRLSDVLRQAGELPVAGTASLGILAAGVIGGDDDVRRLGGRMLLSLATSLVTTEILKRAVGRGRPDGGKGPWDFDPLRKRQVSFPSGHTAMAFTLATTLADEIDGPVADVLVYTFAGGTALSRLYDRRHWPSDVAAGAWLGLATSKMMSGRWRVLGVDGPSFVRDRSVAPTPPDAR